MSECGHEKVRRFGPKRRPVEKLFLEKVDTRGECWTWTAYRSESGYGSMSTRVNCRHKSVQAHRLSWTLFVGPIPDGLFVLHKCDNRACVRPSHLFVGTAQDNSGDMVAKGRTARGARHRAAKLTPSAVRRIRELRGDGVAVAEIWKEFPQVSKSTIRQVVAGATWRHI